MESASEIRNTTGLPYGDLGACEHLPGHPCWAVSKWRSAALQGPCHLQSFRSVHLACALAQVGKRWLVGQSAKQVPMFPSTSTTSTCSKCLLAGQCRSSESKAPETCSHPDSSAAATLRKTKLRVGNQLRPISCAKHTLFSHAPGAGLAYNIIQPYNHSS